MWLVREVWNIWKWWWPLVSICRRGFGSWRWFGNGLKWTSCETTLGTCKPGLAASNSLLGFDMNTHFRSSRSQGVFFCGDPLGVCFFLDNRSQVMLFRFSSNLILSSPLYGKPPSAATETAYTSALGAEDDKGRRDGECKPWLGWTRWIIWWIGWDMLRWGNGMASWFCIAWCLGYSSSRTDRNG